jgi:type I restriction enzyme S subunit
MSEVRKIPRLRFLEFIDHWEKKELGEIGKVINGITYNPSQIDNNGVLVLRSSNIQDGRLTFDDNVFVKVDNYNPVKLYDILICVRNGSQRLIGKNAIIGENLQNTGFGAFMTIYRSQFNQFLFHWFNTSTYYKNVHRNLGATINSINGSDLKKFKVPFPSLREQKKISEFLTSVDRRIELMKKKKSLLETYKKGVMKRIFSQEIRFKDNYGNDFPEWEEKKLGEIVLKKSSNISANSIEDNFGDYIIYGATGEFKRIDFFEVEEPYISIVKDGSGVGRVSLCKPFSSVIGTLDILINKNNSDLNFIYFFLSKMSFLKYVIGSSIPHIYFKDYSKIKLKVPSFEEQQKISSFLLSLDHQIELLNSQIEKSKTWKKGLFQKMFV